jgi:hypothetical protein
MRRLPCSSGMEIQASAALALTKVAWSGHPHLTLLHLISLLWLTLMMIKVKEAEKKKMMMSKAY